MKESSIERRLYNRLLDLVPKDVILYVTKEEWKAIEELYEKRGEAKPLTPVLHGIPIKLMGT